VLVSLWRADARERAAQAQCTTRKWPESVWSLSETDKNGDGVYPESRS